MSHTNNKVGILLPLVFRKTFDYRIPVDIEARPGDYVQVPFGNKSVRGVVWGKAEGGIDESKIKTIESISAHLPPMSDAMRKFIDWVSWYTLAPAGQVLKMALPVPDALDAVKSEKWQLTATIKLTPARNRIIAYMSDGIARSAKEIILHAKVSANLLRDFIKAGGLTRVEEIVTAVDEFHFSPTHCELSTAQSDAAATLRKHLTEGFSVTLVDGVTGSGKTEVYFDTIEACIRQNKQVLVMLPEIALSVQWLTRFKKRFGFAPNVWHSSVSPAKKRDAWRKVAEGAAHVVVGARSALFLPFKNLGLIVVDEEHDPSYKQEEGVIYHARDMTIVRARHEKIPVVLVSATPSLETENNIENGRYKRVHLPTRHNEADMPEVRLIDMRKTKLGKDKWISEPLKEALSNTLADKHQSMIFMNRRGYAPLMLCRACGHRFQCPDCSAWLVLHRSKSKLLCHHCGHTAPVPKDCPDCSAKDSLIPFGTGVERIAEELRELFPDAKVAVMTSDHIEEKAGDIIHSMINHEIDILVGTQMMAKGHHFAGLALVGVIDADMGLAGGDLRAGERTYQLLHQLSGRAGREKAKGTVYLQTYMPEHPVMQALKAGDRDRFMQLEAEMREDAAMPPYGKLAAVIVEGANEQEVAQYARELVKIANACKVTPPLALTSSEGIAAPAYQHDPDSSPLVLGPAPAPLSRLKNKYRYRILIKATRDFALQEWLSRWLFEHKIPASIKLKVDVEPYSFI